MRPNGHKAVRYISHYREHCQLKAINMQPFLIQAIVI